MSSSNVQAAEDRGKKGKKYNIKMLLSNRGNKGLISTGSMLRFFFRKYKN
jgi:hypothetical protein